MLDAREKAILALLMRGKTQQAVANRLCLSLRHTQYLIRMMRRRFEARSVVHMVAIVLAKGLLDNPVEVRK